MQMYMYYCPDLDEIAKPQVANPGARAPSSRTMIYISH
jgi:hypothetical protein